MGDIDRDALKQVIHKFRVLEGELYFTNIYKVDLDNPVKELRKAIEELACDKIEAVC